MSSAIPIGALLGWQAVEEINDILSFRTDWVVEEATSPFRTQFLRVFRPDGAGGRIFITSLPRHTDADVICAFWEACRHYFEMGRDQALSGGLAQPCESKEAA